MLVLACLAISCIYCIVQELFRMFRNSTKSWAGIYTVSQLMASRGTGKWEGGGRLFSTVLSWICHWLPCTFEGFRNVSLKVTLPLRPSTMKLSYTHGIDVTLSYLVWHQSNSSLIVSSFVIRHISIICMSYIQTFVVHSYIHTFEVHSKNEPQMFVYKTCM